MADGLSRYLAQCPTAGIKLSDSTCLNVIRIQVLGFANDFALIAPTVEDLQILVDATHKWCEILDMRLEGAKTQYLYLNPDPGTPGPYPTELCRGHINPVQEAKYIVAREPVRPYAYVQHRRTKYVQLFSNT